MEMTKDVILARQLRLATISNLVGQGILDEPSAKELLSGALEPGNDSTIVDDSALLGDPEALVKIAAEQLRALDGACRPLTGRNGKPTNVCACGGSHEPPRQ